MKKIDGIIGGFIALSAIVATIASLLEHNAIKLGVKELPTDNETVMEHSTED